jgi:16S rRNA (cytidine1402-2'-O)-methyltransferase
MFAGRYCIRAGISTKRLPLKKGRQTRLQQLAEEERTMIFYESPHRLVKTLRDFASFFGTTRQASVSRELTKLFEDTQRNTLEGLAAYYEKNHPKGEIVIVVGGNIPVKKGGKKEDSVEE